MRFKGFKGWAFDPDAESNTDADAMAILLGGSATAAGDETSTFGDVDLTVRDYGAVTVAFGQSSFYATGGAAAEADTYAIVTGADISFTRTIDYTFDYGPHGSAAFSKTFTFALDIEAPAFGRGNEAEVSTEGNSAISSVVAGLFGTSGSTDVVFTSHSVDDVGSGATVDIASPDLDLSLSGSVYGTDTVVAAEATALHVEDTFSYIDGSVLGIG